uniref:RING-type domain-containing protein n=1 Tax=Glossina pallidipes TaxID=7398 RepID=A0A1A9ZQM5_GLOPL
MDATPSQLGAESLAGHPVGQTPEIPLAVISASGDDVINPAATLVSSRASLMSSGLVSQADKSSRRKRYHENLLVADTNEQALKKQKVGTSDISRDASLTGRLSGLLCCVVCLNLSKISMYQCRRGHLMCADCFNHLLADGRLRDQFSTCPSCRVDISYDTVVRNYCVEDVIYELPTECRYCSKEFPNKLIYRHERNECEQRPTHCKYSRVGCQWLGPRIMAPEHESKCACLNKSAQEIVNDLRTADNKAEDEKKIFNAFFDLLSHENMAFIELRFKPLRSNESPHKLFFKTSRFSAFNLEWIVKTTVNNYEREPCRSSARVIAYQLILKTKIYVPMDMDFFAGKGPYSTIRMFPQVYKYTFTEFNTTSDWNDMSLIDSDEVNRLLANYDFNIRFFMFLGEKQYSLQN